jgi:hypothetical protein
MIDDNDSPIADDSGGMYRKHAAASTQQQHILAMIEAGQICQQQLGWLNCMGSYVDRQCYLLPADLNDN